MVGTLVTAAVGGVPAGFVLAVFVFRINPKLLVWCVGAANIVSAAATHATDAIKAKVG